MILAYALAHALMYYTSFKPTCSANSTMTEELLFKDRYLFVLSKVNACLSPRSVIDKNVMTRFNSIEIESWVVFLVYSLLTLP